jgi:hypothetical protein
MAAIRDTDKTDTVAVELRPDRASPRLYNSLDAAPFRVKRSRRSRPTTTSRPEAEEVPASIRHHFELRRDSERHRRLGRQFRACNLRVVRWLGPGA